MSIDLFSEYVGLYWLLSLSRNAAFLFDSFAQELYALAIRVSIEFFHCMIPRGIALCFEHVHAADDERTVLCDILLHITPHQSVVETLSELQINHSYLRQ